MKGVSPPSRRGTIAELRLLNFRSFGNLRLCLEDLTILVGRNGSGKTTVLDAFDFLRDALTDGLTIAIEKNDGLSGIIRRPNPLRPLYVYLVAVINLGKGKSLYGFSVGLGGMVSREVLWTGDDATSFRRDSEGFKTGVPDVQPDLAPDSLALPVVAGSRHEWWRTLYALRGARSYVLSPDAIGQELAIRKSLWLNRNGDNAAEILRNLERAGRAKDLEWVTRHLAAVTPGIVNVGTAASGGRRRVIFEQQFGPKARHRFDGHQMSSGTLRCLGVLLALRQKSNPSLVLVDELEDSIHPAALSVLMDAIEASLDHCKVVITTHSPELLTHGAATAKRVRILDWKDGQSKVYPVSPEVADSLKPPESVGRLLRSNALWPAEEPSVVEGGIFEI